MISALPDVLFLFFVKQDLLLNYWVKVEQSCQVYSVHKALLKFYSELYFMHVCYGNKKENYY